MNWLDFSKYETSESKFTAELSKKGGYIIFSNSGKGGNKKYFTLSLESFLTCLKDIKANHSYFSGHENYNEKEWRDLGSQFYTDEAANAQCTVQTKPMFSTLSKIIMWANSPNLDQINPEEFISLELDNIDVTIENLASLSNEFIPNNYDNNLNPIEQNIIISENSIRDFAKLVFFYFFGENWEDFLKNTTQRTSNINNIDFISHDYEIFKRIIGEFENPQTKENLTSSSVGRFFPDPIFTDENKYFYFSTQWNGEGDYSLSFKNLKGFFETKFPEYHLLKKNGAFLLIKLEPIPESSFNKEIFVGNLKSSGLIYSSSLVNRFIGSLITKPFVILTGLSGSGKTKLAQAFVQWICQNEEQYKMVPVGADWTNREPLLGFPNALNPEEYVKPDSGVLDLIIEAAKEENQDKPYFLILDEMNLSQVERYFADFLSVMESGEDIPLFAEGTVENGVPAKLRLPSNLFVIGTVNIDETTNMFSPKVLDRANTIEFRVMKDEMESFLENMREIEMNPLVSKGAGMARDFLRLASNRSFETNEIEEIRGTLLKFFVELKKTGAEFGYRSASEILRLIHQLSVLDENLTTDEKLDIAIMHKLLPKLHGSRRKLCPVLARLGSFCIDGNLKIEKDVFENPDFDFEGNNVLYPLSLEKIARMHRGAVENGYSSFAEA